MIQLKTLVGYLAVSILWGCTNPFIKHAQKVSSPAAPVFANKENKKFSIWETILNLRRSFSNFKIFMPFILNQSGSALFYCLLSTEPVSVASPVCNSLTFIFTALTSHFIFKENVKYPWMLAVGIVFILCGTVLCL
jgi:drug/metabolite transporter (DMT)-like permease